MIEEQEFLELASSEALLAELQKVLSTDAQRWLTDLDDGIHSEGLETSAQRACFSISQLREIVDALISGAIMILETRRIIDNRYHIMDCRLQPDTPRFPPLPRS